MIKKMLIGTLIFSNSIFASIDTNRLSKLDIDALVVKDLSKKDIVYSKDMYQSLKPASLTKIMTSLLAINSGKMNNIVTITEEAVSVEPTKAGYRVGEKIYLRDLVKAAMIQSANDAAMAIGIYLGNGNIENFVVLMNRYAKAIGMQNTNFTNPCGFDIKNHQSNAADLLKLTEFAIKNPQFNAIAKMNKHVYRSTSGRQYVAYTHNKLLGRYKYAVGVKTGYTSKAGPCLIARAKKDNKDLLVVMLNSREDRWKTAQYIFDNMLDNKTATATKKSNKNTNIKRKSTPKNKNRLVANNF
ncbi:MAG: D-alanyl-D-alanine carboxypeptidase [Campylobacterales bacterium]|nr:D-alanyl-D-alanine carboxypeptidase [Campylobacterales bacterium]